MISVLRHAYTSMGAGFEGSTDAQLRFATRASSEDVRSLMDRQLLLSERGSGNDERVRPTVLGLLHLDEALSDLDALERVLGLLAARYAPTTKAATVAFKDVYGELAIPPSQAARVTAFAGDLRVGHSDEVFYPNERIYEAGGRLGRLIVESFQYRYKTEEPRKGFLHRAEPLPIAVRLRGVQAANFRALRRFDLSLGEVTVVVGPNGVGKSTVIDVAGFVSRVANLGLQRAQFDHPTEYLRTRGSTGPIEFGIAFEIDHGDGPIAAEYRFAIDDLHGKTVVEGESLVLVENGVRRPLIDTKRGRSRIERPDGSIATLYGGADVLALTEFASESGFPHIERIRRAISRIVLIDTDPVLAVGDSADVWGNQDSLGRRSRAAIPISEILEPILQDEKIVARLGEVLTELIPSMSGVERVIELDTPTLRFREDGLQGTLSFEELSSGTRQMLLLAALYVQPQPRAAVLLEEPDARIYPAALPVLADLMRSIGRTSTVLATTHSPAFIGALDASAEVFGLERADGTVRAAPLGELAKSKGWLRDFGVSREAFARVAAERRR